MVGTSEIKKKNEINRSTDEKSLIAHKNTEVINYYIKSNYWY